MKIRLLKLTLFLILIPLPFLTIAQATSQSTQADTSYYVKPDIFVTWTEKDIKIDGVLDDAAWKDAKPYEGYFYQREPLDREPSTQKTKVMALQDEKMLYFGIQCYDSEPDKIFASAMRRDKTYGSGDVVELLLDTFQDNRNCYSFDTNPLGGKGDAIISDRGNHINKEWEAVVYMDGAYNDEGWAAEFAIPFKSLKYKKGELVDWNINISREIVHRNEETYLAPIPREWGHRAKFRGELWGQLRNIRPPKPGLDFEVSPYALAGQTNIYGDHSERRTQTHAGVDFKYDITSQLALDLTYKTDFAQAEADEEIVNVTRFNIRRQEKRDFFLQNAGLFQFGPGSRTQSNFMLFDSRSIGIQDRQRVPLLGGGKLTGRVGKYSIAALNMQSEKITLRDGTVMESTNYTAVRVKRDISNDSHLGMMLLNQSATSDDYSRAVGVDGLWNVTQDLRLDASAARSFAPHVNGNDMAGDVGIVFNKEWLDVDVRYTHIDSLFNPQMGFVRRSNIRSLDSDITLTKWINKGHIQNIAFSSGVAYITDHHQTLKTRDVPLSASVVFRKGDEIEIGVVRSYEFVPRDAYIRDIRIDAGVYETWLQELEFSAYRGRPVHGRVSMEWGELFDGTQQSVMATGSAKVSNHLNVDLSYTFNHLDLQNGNLDSHVLSTRWTYAFTPDFFTKAYLQWNSADNRFSGNILVDWAYRPRSHLYLVYNETRNTLVHEPIDRIFMMKLTYLWQI